MNLLQTAKADFTNCPMTGEEYMARLYCEPKPFWHCTRQLDGSRYYTFEEKNFPQHWLRIVEKYTGQELSAAAKQLHRRVEAARAEFRAKQDKAWGKREVGSHTPARYERLESSAWNTFNAQKRNYLKDYLRAIKSGIIPRPRGKKCIECKAAFVSGRKKYCPVCAKIRTRESNRKAQAKAKAKKRSSRSENWVSHPPPSQGLAEAHLAKKGLLATPIADGPFSGVPNPFFANPITTLPTVSPKKLTKRPNDL